MNNMENNKLSAEALNHAIVLARTHCEGMEERCRRYRRRTTIRRVACVAVLIVATVLAVDILMAVIGSRPSAQGALSLASAMECVQQIILNA